MYPSVIRFLLLSSFILLAACASTKVQQEKLPCNIPASFNWDTTTVYKASISVMNKNFSGLIIFNRENDTDYRLIMTTDVGPKLIDITLTPKGYTKNFVMAQLDRKALLRMFWEDFGTMLGIFAKGKPGYSDLGTCCYPVSKNFTSCYITSDLKSFPLSAYFVQGNEKKTKINYFCAVGQQPDSIRIDHLALNMSYFLNKLN